MSHFLSFNPSELKGDKRTVGKGGSCYHLSVLPTKIAAKYSQTIISNPLCIDSPEIQFHSLPHLLLILILFFMFVFIWWENRKKGHKAEYISQYWIESFPFSLQSSMYCTVEGNCETLQVEFITVSKPFKLIFICLNFKSC